MMQDKFSLLSVLVAVTVMLNVLPAFSGDTYDQAVAVREDTRSVTVYGTIDMNSDATGNFYTQAIYIGDCNYYHAFIAAWTNNKNGDDVDVFVEYSYDRATWKGGLAGSGKLLDQLTGGTVQADTIDVIAAAKEKLFPAMPYIRFKFDGQTGNPDTVDITFVATFTKTDETAALLRSNRARNKI